VQSLFKFGDGERLVGAMSFDPRVITVSDTAGEPAPPYAVAITKGGLAFRFPVSPHKDPSTRSGRKFARLKEGDEVLTVFLQIGSSYVIAAAEDGHAIAVETSDLALLSGVGQGTMLIKLAPGVRLVGAVGAPSPRVGPLIVSTEKGRKFELFAEALLSSRGGRGKQVVKRSTFVEVELPLPAVPDLIEEAK
jgi:DNA gyrase subunit A